jgi:hypothetical protein
MACQGVKQRIVGVIFALTLLMAPVLAVAAEVKFPVSAYTPEELAKVREWEKTWAGKKIDKTNIDQVAEFFPESYIDIYKDPEKWGTPPGVGLYFYIIPYKQIIETKGMIEATKKYAPLVKTDSDGEITNYAEIAGFPFPDPKTGLEIAYNTECQNRGDTYHMRWFAPVVDPRARTDRVSDQEFDEMYFIHRTEVDPKPAVPDNPKGYHHGQFVHFRLPPEMNNSRFIVLKFIDQSIEFKSYLYYSDFRRIRRLSQAERSNAIDGTDMIYDDGNMWDGYLNRNTYKSIGKKELLLSRQQDMDKVTRVPGQAMASGYTFERCNTYMVEVINKDPHYIYSKRIWYVDPETYSIHWQEMWDETGKFWKCFIQPTNSFKTAKGEMKNFHVGYVIQDFQRMHSGFTHMKISGISIEVSPKIFLLSNLQKSY